MSEDNSLGAKSSRIKNPILWGLLLTALLALIVTVLALSVGPSGKVRVVEFGSLHSNEIGDTLAGIFAPLAFIWIVVTVFLQSQELAEQRRELALTREELRLAREAQEKMVEAAQLQASIFSDEKLFRDQEEEKKTFDLKLQYLARDILPLVGTLSHIEEHSSLFNDQTVHRSISVVTSPGAEANIDEIVRHFSDQISGEASLLDQPPSKHVRIVALDGISQEGLRILLKRSKLAAESEASLSVRERIRFNELRLTELCQALAYLCDHSDLWDWEKEGRSWVLAK